MLSDAIRCLILSHFCCLAPQAHEDHDLRKTLRGVRRWAMNLQNMPGAVSCVPGPGNGGR